MECFYYHKNMVDHACDAQIKCCGLKVGPFRVHWHVGGEEDGVLITPSFRLRSIFVFGMKIPLKYAAY